MIFVDTSVWIDYFNGKVSPETECLQQALGMQDVLIGDLIALEILQGFREDKDYKIAKQMLDAFTLHNLLGSNAVISCAENYRRLRKKGITVRKTADVIIATFCIDRKIPLLFSDRDFQPFVEHLGLRSAL